MWYKDQSVPKRLQFDDARARLEIYTIDDPVAQPRYTLAHQWEDERVSSLRVLRGIDIPATLTHEAYSRCRENGSSPFAPRKSRRDLTSREETGKASRVPMHEERDIEKRRRNKKMRGKRWTNAPSFPANKEGERNSPRFRVKVNEAGKRDPDRSTRSRKNSPAHSVRSRKRVGNACEIKGAGRFMGRAISVSHQGVAVIFRHPPRERDARDKRRFACNRLFLICDRTIGSPISMYGSMKKRYALTISRDVRSWMHVRRR